MVQVVLGARASHAGRRPAGHVALELARSLRKPLVVVPPDASVPVTLRRILVPLDGTPRDRRCSRRDRWPRVPLED